jgi:hypothetical protein
MNIDVSLPPVCPDARHLCATFKPFLPRFIRLRDAPSDLGMDKNRFNREVRPLLSAISGSKDGDQLLGEGGWE